MTNQSGAALIPRTKGSYVLLVAGLLLIALVGTVLLIAGRARRTEVAGLTQLLSLHSGMTVAEIGAGRGWLTVAVAERVGPAGRVYSTELNPARLGDIRRAAADAGLANVMVVEAGERETNLPAGCCEAIFMRRVYHHLSDPSAVLAGIHEALKPGGRLAIIEFRRRGVVGSVTGMGVERGELVEAVTSAGFDVAAIDEWPWWDHYITVFEKRGR